MPSCRYFWTCNVSSFTDPDVVVHESTMHLGGATSSPSGRRTLIVTTPLLVPYGKVLAGAPSTATCSVPRPVAGNSAHMGKRMMRLFLTGAKGSVVESSSTRAGPKNGWAWFVVEFDSILLEAGQWLWAGSPVRWSSFKMSISPPVRRGVGSNLGIGTLPFPARQHFKPPSKGVGLRRSGTH